MKILAIGDTADNNHTLKKFAERSRVHLIDFPKKGVAKTSNVQSGREYFDSLLISKLVDKIREIKDDYDLCIVLSWAAARVAYLSGINYIMYFVGSDIGNPPFAKNNIPTGIQIVGKTFDDVSVFQAANNFERIDPWYENNKKRPHL